MLATNYATDAERVQQQLQSILALNPKFLDAVKLKAEKELLDTRIMLNNQLIAGKKKETNKVVKLESLSNILVSICELINTANAQVVKHNQMVGNLTNERKTLTAQVWRFILEK